MRLLLALLLTSMALPAAASPWEARVVARSTPDDAFSVNPIQARVGDAIELSLVLISPDGDVLGNMERVQLNRHRPRAPHAALPEGVAVRWLEVVPRQEHLEIPPPNPGIPTFSNSVLFGPHHGDWLGYDQMEYDTVPLEATSSALVVDHARPHWGQPSTQGAGSSWFAVEVTLPDGTVVRSADGDDVDQYGLSAQVQRVSFRAGDDFVDWLGTYFNVPHLFGSAGPSDRRNQAERYLGADCADALVGAWRAAGHDDVSYGSVGGIGRDADAVTGDLFIGLDGVVRDADGAPVELGWGEDVRRGDLIVFDFIQAGAWLPRHWDHIGALAEDSGPLGMADGRLDWNDVVRHMGRRGLVDAPLWQLGETRIRIWRWDD